VLVAACGRLGFSQAAAGDGAGGGGGGGGGGGDGSSCRGLDSTWTPEWSKLIEYAPFDGTGGIPNFATVPAAVGMNAFVGNADDAGMSYVPGKVGQAIEFDGVDDFVTLPLPNVDTTSGDAITIALWMRWNGVLYAGNTGNWTKVLYFPAPEYTLAFTDYEVSPSFGFNTGNGDLWGLDANGLANTWVHVVAEFANSTQTDSVLYLNGQPQSLAMLVGSPSTSAVSNPVTVAAYPGYPSYYAGDLDEVAAWNTALTAEEVATLYGAQAGCP